MVKTAVVALYTRALDGLAALQRADGQGLAEYALILTLVAAVAVAALTLLGGNVGSAVNNIASSL